MTILKRRLALVLVAVTPAAALAFGGDEPSAIDPMAALEAHGHEFDFMVGKWIELGPEGKRKAYVTWKTLPGGTAAFEVFKDFGRWYAHKFVTFARHEVEPRWVQTSVDGAFEPAPPGYHLTFRGGREEDGRMVLFGEGRYYEGERVPERLGRFRQTYAPQADGTVLYLWEVSFDDGTTWTDTWRTTLVPFFE